MDNKATEVKKELTADELALRESLAMPNKQMLRRLRRIIRGSKKRPTSNIDATWAIVLESVLANTKPIGRMEPYLR